MKKYSLELLISLLLAISLIGPLVNDSIFREIKLLPNLKHSTDTASDKVVGGASWAKDSSDAAAFKLDFDLKDSCNNPFVILSIKSDLIENKDLTWMENVKIKVRLLKNEKMRFRFHLRNIESAYIGQNSPTDFRYNEITFDADKDFKEILLEKKHFNTPSWWIDMKKLDPLDNLPKFDSISHIEIATGSLERKNRGLLEIEYISIRGHWVDPLLLYEILLAMWVFSFVIVLFSRFYKLHKNYINIQSSENNLRRANKNLESESMAFKEKALHDALTGLLNREGLKESIKMANSEYLKMKSPFSVIILDADLFKKINDTKGHAFGDKILCCISKILLDRVRGRDKVARWGGEEFVVLCRHTTLNEASQLAEQLRIEIEKDPFQFTCSFGVAEVCEKNDNFDKVFSMADLKLYASKEGGRNKISF